VIRRRVLSEPFEQKAPGRVDKDGQIGIIIYRTDANPAASAWYDPSHPAAHAVGWLGNKR